MIAGDRAAGPLGVARENTRLYLRRNREHSDSLSSSDFDTRAKEDSRIGTPRIRRYVGLTDSDGGADGDATSEARERPVQDGSSGLDGTAATGAVPRLECRLGDGLAVLENGEVDTVCIAGVGAYVLVFILLPE